MVVGALVPAINGEAALLQRVLVVKFKRLWV